ncbi:di-trans,poly-cis-decaprenylcistransferase [archaeon]|nr:di-trans,poly-cis-decaprenylcistransferase [archaeon]
MKVPKHIGIILDGNRRFAKRLMLKPWMGHEWGSKRVEKLFEWCVELDIKELTLYALSLDNMKRPKKEFDYLMDVFRKEIGALIDDKRLDDNKIKINFIGRLWLLPKNLQNLMDKVVEKTKDYDKHVINIALAYGGKAEVIDAAKKIAEQVRLGKLNVDDINERTFSKNLYFSDFGDVDLIIRTGGEKRTSDFIPMQGAYAELIFLDKLWPEFEKKDFENCIKEYDKRQRRFGR